MKAMKKLPVIILLVALTGCTAMNHDLDCPMKNGVRCQSLDEVNAAIDRGEIGSAGTKMDIQKASSTQPSGFHPDAVPASGQSMMRHPERTMRIWIAPHEDSNGNYHEAGSIHAVIHPGSWTESPQDVSEGE